MTAPAVPVATYRLQLNADFRFDDARRIVPYLHELGISHVYASPYLKARAGSMHGYDIVDHNALNPEIGDQTRFDQLVAELHRHDMGQILDIVPNHMAVGGSDNAWWLDVLEHGEASAYAPYFDIDWHPVKQALQNKVLLPFLGDHYGTVLERGELRLRLDCAAGALSVHYYDHLFPLDPCTYPQLLGAGGDAPSGNGPSGEAVAALDGLIEQFRALPRHTDAAPGRRRVRREDAARCKRGLADLCQTHPEIAAHLEHNVERFNGTPGEADSFDLLHRLLETQPYRLAYWKVASDEINYRRFFDINELAGLRMEDRDAFAATHRLIGDMLERGQIEGMRIDHVDGLYDPLRYCTDLQDLARDRRGAGETDEPRPVYLLVEKVLGGHERLPAAWPVAGTTGYETAQLLNGLLVYPESERRLSRLYTRFTGHGNDFNELLYERKKLIIHSVLSSELTVLANLLSGIAQADRHTRDFTYHGLRDALAKVVACYPVYRSYVTAAGSSDEDRRDVQWAVAQAKKRSPVADLLTFDFIHDLLILNDLQRHGPNLQHRIVQFIARFEQYTAPVMAKGMEDTAFYAYNRLVSLNDVGFDPRSFGVSTAAFHHENRLRLANWPHAMVSTSTHDSKRGEDVRARIDVLSEVPDDWRRHLARWSRINRSRKRLVDDRPAPSRNDEYLLYQTLLGAWPLEPLDDAGLGAFRERIEGYMIKAVREAKTHTSWINPGEEYEQAVRHFVRALLRNPGRSAFLADFLPFQKRMARYGLLNSLSQTLLKLTAPGVPDIYQGNELWAFNLVDPDNRRPVDYARRTALLETLRERYAEPTPALARGLLERIEDSRAKLYLTWQTLKLRQHHAAVFSEGDYLGLSVQGPRADHICAFARQHQGVTIVVAAARWFARLTHNEPDALPERRLWEGTAVALAETPAADGYRNLLTGETVPLQEQQDGPRLSAADLFASFPVALLSSELSGQGSSCAPQ
ncbi:MAG: malto-oligosyltrehalose synthase [Gammaproteobacteria bacterium]|jgi:(1->4)-alpha-D-glucan 1-alpha-D-glucosylmutase